MAGSRIGDRCQTARAVVAQRCYIAVAVGNREQRAGIGVEYFFHAAFGTQRVSRINKVRYPLTSGAVSGRGNRGVSGLRPFRSHAIRPDAAVTPKVLEKEV